MQNEDISVEDAQTKLSHKERVLKKQERQYERLEQKSEILEKVMRRDEEKILRLQNIITNLDFDIDILHHVIANKRQKLIYQCEELDIKVYTFSVIKLHAELKFLFYLKQKYCRDCL